MAGRGKAAAKASVRQTQQNAGPSAEAFVISKTVSKQDLQYCSIREDPLLYLPLLTRGDGGGGEGRNRLSKTKGGV